MPDAALPDFDALAETYERLAEPLTGPFSHRALLLAALPPGAAIVDVAAGTGALAVPAARAGLRVTALDLAPGMVARLAPKLAPFPGCRADVGDCTALPAADGSFDAAVSIFGIAILPVWAAGLAEMVRVTRSGGTVVVGAWPAGGARPLALLRETFAALFPARPFWPDAPFPDWTADGLGDALRAAGCREAAVHPAGHDYVKPDAETFVADAMPFFGTVPGVVALPPADRARLEAAYAAALAPFTDAAGAIRLPVEAMIGVGRAR